MKERKKNNPTPKKQQKPPPPATINPLFLLFQDNFKVFVTEKEKRKRLEWKHSEGFWCLLWHGKLFYPTFY